MVGPAAKREAVAHLQADLGLSERRACSIASADRKMIRYRSRQLCASSSANGEPMVDAGILLFDRDDHSLFILDFPSRTCAVLARSRLGRRPTAEGGASAALTALSTARQWLCRE